MRLSDFDFDLPPELIAQEPLSERDRSRLLCVDTRAGTIAHRQVRDLPGLLQSGDLLVANNSRVFPARLRGATENDASVELLLLGPVGSGGENRWEALARPARRLRVGIEAFFGGGVLSAVVVDKADYGRITVELRCKGDLFDILERIGETPLPPYIKREGRVLEDKDRERYQTVYARERGSIAAPTAGLHFTPDLLRALEARSVDFAQLTLHVGYGTFQPIRTETVEEHRMEPEWFEIPAATSGAIETARAAGGHVVAVGTTTVRTLESRVDRSGRVRPGSDVTRLFIYPGFRFQVVDALLTNFHLPQSSLFLLVSAFGGNDLMRRAYEEAIRERYRFYSYGDCMLITA
jgi:S-adenosylmethionine:tRNA ribosyltransferase-isomerase